MSFQYVSEHREYLKREYQARSQRRPLYSQRAFARDIGLSPSSLTDYFKGRIRLSPGRIGQVSKSIGLSLEQRQHWMDLVAMKFAKAPEIKHISKLRVKARLESQNHAISLDQFKVISEWFHMAFLELLQVDAKMYSNLKQASAALEVPLRSLKVAVNRLEKVGLLQKGDDGIYNVGPWTQFGDSVPSMAIRQFHTQLMKKASQALDTQPLDRRFASSTIVALPKTEVDKILIDIKSLAVRYLDPHLNVPGTLAKDSLYCLSMQFFDLLSHKQKEVDL